MNKWTLSILTAALVAAGFLGFQATVAQPAPADAPRFAAVNVMKALTECQENLDREKVIDQREQDFQTKLDQLKAEASEIRQELEQALKPGTPEYLERMQEFFNKMALAEAYDKGQRQAFAAETQAWMEMLYRKFLDQVAELARLEGLQIVFAKDELPIQQAENLGELTSAIRSRKVLFASPTLDITGRVMERMDRAYTQEKAAAGS